jgi:hypothetical protein
MHAYKIRRDEDYVAAPKQRGKAKVEGISGDTAVAAHPSPARALQSVLAERLAEDQAVSRFSPRAQMAIIGMLTLLAWTPIIGSILIAIG